MNKLRHLSIVLFILFVYLFTFTLTEFTLAQAEYKVNFR